MRGRASPLLPLRRRRWTRAKDYWRKPPRSGRWRGKGGGKSNPPGFLATLIMLPLAAFTAVFLWDGGRDGFPMPFGARDAGGQDREQASFSRCGGWARNDCVIDGDTFWYEGSKIRIADINTPETSSPGCAYEAQLGEQASRRLLALLNEGAFSLQSIDRDEDQYGRKLRVVTRGGQSLGTVLVREGLAERWQGYRRDWC